MKALYKDSLPATAQDLVDRIEGFAKREIEVVVDPLAEVSSTDPNPTRPAMTVTENWARITLPTPSFEPNGILHEVLHIERHWVDGIPQVEPAHPDAPKNNWTVTSSIENSLEHLIIVPREEQYGFNPYPYWARTERALWEKYPWPTLDPFARRMHALFGSLAVFNLSKDEELIALARHCLKQDGMLKESIRFNRLVKDVLHTKEKMLRLGVEHLGIPKAETRLRYIDIRTHRRWYAPI
jgi:hypothetical protein